MADKLIMCTTTPPTVKVFDLLYLNGQSLIHRSTAFRKRNLRACIKEISGRIEFAIEYRGTTAKEIRERMDEIMGNRGEGLVIKHPQSKYILNGRNMDWIKVSVWILHYRFPPGIELNFLILILGRLNRSIWCVHPFIIRCQILNRL